MKDSPAIRVGKHGPVSGILFWRPWTGIRTRTAGSARGTRAAPCRPERAEDETAEARRKGEAALAAKHRVLLIVESRGEDAEH